MALDILTPIQQGLNIRAQQRQARLQDQQLQQAQVAQQQKLSAERERALFQDARSLNQLVRAGNIDQAEQLVVDRIQGIQQLGGDPTQSAQVAQLFQQGKQTGDFSQLHQVLDGGDLIAVNRGILPAAEPKKKTKAESRTSSQKDFETFQQLNEKARISGDPVDVELARQFGVQAGFDRLTPQQEADIDVDKASRVALAKQASEASKEAFDGLKNVRSTIANMNDAIKALNKGAETGPIISRLPSFRAAAIELDNIKGRMGLDVVGATTFGALSESELAFALDTALPTSLEPKELREWLKRKKESQTKLAKGLREAASFLGKPGNTIAGFIEQQEAKARKGQSGTGLSPEEEAELQRLEQQFGGR